MAAAEEFEHAFRKAMREINLAEESRAPALLSCVRRLSEKAGLKHPPRIFVARSALSNAGVGRMPHGSGHFMLLTEGLFDALGNGNVHHHVNDKLETVIAHELGHVKHAGLHHAAANWPVFMFPLAAVAGLYLYEKSRHNLKAQGKNSDDPKALHQEMEKVENTSPPPDKELQNTMTSAHLGFHYKGSEKDALRMGKYFAVAALGLGAGVGAAILGARWREFHADRFMKHLTGNSSALIESLKDLERHMETVLAKIARGEEKIPKAFNVHHPNPFKMFMRWINNFHPSLEERAAALGVSLSR